MPLLSKNSDEKPSSVGTQEEQFGSLFGSPYFQSQPSGTKMAQSVLAFKSTAEIFEGAKRPNKNSNSLPIEQSSKEDSPKFKGLKEKMLGLKERVLASQIKQRPLDSKNSKAGIPFEILMQNSEKQQKNSMKKLLNLTMPFKTRREFS